MVPYHHHHHHQERRGAHGQPLPHWRLPAQRPVVLLRLLGPPVDALGRHCRRGHQPEHTVHSFLSYAMQAASAAAEDPDAVVLSVSGNAVLVQERGAPEQSGEGERIVSAVPEILPAAIRRGGVPSQHAAAAQRPHLHRLPPRPAQAKAQQDSISSCSHRLNEVAAAAALMFPDSMEKKSLAL